MTSSTNSKLVNEDKPDYRKFIDIANNKTLLKYFQNVQKHFIYAKNFGLALDDEDNLGGTGKPVLLEKLFVTPGLLDKPLSPAQLLAKETQNKTKKEKLKFHNLISVLKNNQRFFLLGDPGTGKSTLVDWLMLALTSSEDNKIKQTIGNTVPFMMPLREMEFNGINSWDDLFSLDKSASDPCWLAAVFSGTQLARRW